MFPNEGSVEMCAFSTAAPREVWNFHTMHRRKSIKGIYVYIPRQCAMHSRHVYNALQADAGHVMRTGHPNVAGRKMSPTLQKRCGCIIHISSGHGQGFPVDLKEGRCAPTLRKYPPKSSDRRRTTSGCSADTSWVSPISERMLNSSFLPVS